MSYQSTSFKVIKVSETLKSQENMRYSNACIKQMVAVTAYSIADQESIEPLVVQPLSHSPDSETQTEE